MLTKRILKTVPTVLFFPRVGVTFVTAGYWKIKRVLSAPDNLTSNLVEDSLFRISSNILNIEFNLQFEIIINFLIMLTIGSTQYNVGVQGLAT